MRRGGAHQLAAHAAVAPVVQHVQRLHLALRQAAAGDLAADAARPAVANPTMREPLPGGTSTPDADATNTAVDDADRRVVMRRLAGHRQPRQEASGRMPG